MTLRSLWESWVGWLCQPVSVLPMALFRIVVGFTMLSFALLLWPHATVLLGHDSIFSIDASRSMLSGPAQHFFLFFPHGPSGDPFVAGTLILLAVASICLSVGLFTNFSALLCFILIVGITFRNPMIEHAGYRILALWCLYLAVSRAGNMLSLDALIARRWQSEAPSTVAPAWPMRLVQMQLAAVYISAVWVKLNGDVWLSGDAVYYVLRLPSFTNFPLPEFMYSAVAGKVLSWGTLLVECAFPLLVWFRETRAYVLIGGLLLHAGLNYALNVPLFQLTMLAAYCTFLSEADYKFLANKLIDVVGNLRVVRQQ